MWLYNVLRPIIDALHGLLNFFNGYTNDLALSIVLMTLVVKLVLHPLTRIQLRSMKAMQLIAPAQEAIKRKYKDDPRKQQEELMALFRAHNVNPMMGCLPMLVQMPIIYGLFQLLYNTKNLFGNATVFGLTAVHLSDRPQQLLGAVLKTPAQLGAHPAVLLALLFPVLAGLTTWYQQRLSMTDPTQARMFVFMPIMFGYFSLLYPVGLSLYWIVSTVAYIGEYYLVVGAPHPMSAAPPKSQTTVAAVASGQSGTQPPASAGQGSPKQQKPAAGGAQPRNAPRRKRGARRS